MGSLNQGNIKKIDNAVTDGLLGVNNSAAYRIHEIEKHLHSRGEWFGQSADQSGADWALSVSAAGLMPVNYVAITGDDEYGADANDEAKIIGTGDASGITGMVKFDLHQILILESDSTTIFVLRVCYGTTTLAQAIIDEQCSEFIIRRDTGVNEDHGVPLEIQMPRLTWGTDKVWIQAKNATIDSEIEFLVGLHNYVG